MLDRAQPVRIYWNYKHRCYTIFQCGTVVASARQVHLAEVSFEVRESGRQKMLREQRRIIHAYAFGRLVDFVHPDESRELVAFAGRSIFYDPQQYDRFVTSDSLAPVVTSTEARFDESGTRIPMEHRQAA